MFCHIAGSDSDASVVCRVVRGQWLVARGIHAAVIEEASNGGFNRTTGRVVGPSMGNLFVSVVVLLVREGVGS